MYQELVDNGKVLADSNYVKVTVAMPDYRMKDDKTGVWRKNKAGQISIYDSMDVWVRLIENDEWFEGCGQAKMIRQDDPKKLAERTVARLGEFVAKETHEISHVEEPAAAAQDAQAAAPATPAMPV